MNSAVIGDELSLRSCVLLLQGPFHPRVKGPYLLEIKMIAEFQGEYRFLSNFWPAAVKGPSGLWYASVENAYQASKSLRLLDHQKIVAMSAGQSKRYARGVDL